MGLIPSVPHWFISNDVQKFGQEYQFQRSSKYYLTNNIKLTTLIGKIMLSRDKFTCSATTQPNQTQPGKLEN